VHRARAHQKTHTTWAWQDLGDQEHHSAGHPEKPPPVANALASLITNHLLMFGLCCAYGTIMFDDVNAKHCALGVKISLCTAMVVGVLLAWKCGVCVAIGGLDLNPAVFLGSFVATIAEDIATQFGLECPDKYRRLGSGCGKEVKFCKAEIWRSTWTNASRITKSSEQPLPSLSSCRRPLLAACFFSFQGGCTSQKLASYVPTCVMELFMSCVSYKVFKYALMC